MNQKTIDWQKVSITLKAICDQIQTISHSIITQKPHNPLTGMHFMLSLGLSYRKLFHTVLTQILQDSKAKTKLQEMRHSFFQLLHYAKQRYQGKIHNGL